MNLALTFTVTVLLVLSSLASPASNVPDKITGHDRPEPKNMSQCLPEDVNDCQASGGIFDWKNCMCRYR